MLILLAGLLAATPVKTIAVNLTPTPPRIDGRLESVWNQADSISDFIQYQPVQSAEPTERTVVYVLQDQGNLYVAFRGESRHHRPVAQLYGMEEELTVFLDPMDSRSNGYFFKLYGSGLRRSGLVLDDGRDYDWSWEGIWYGAIRLSADGFEAEFRIPFKSFRYREGAHEWGVNFERFIAANREADAWTEVRVQEGGNLVSRYGRLTGVNPQAHGYYFELYPETFVRYDAGPAEDGALRPRASLNFKWDLTSQTTVNATVLPDFAQIESDPFAFNLSRYRLHLEEQRPFFIEGSEMFRMSGLGEGIFQPLTLFYSRMIGKAIGQEPVPILSGLKLTTTSSRASFGALGAYTDRLNDPSGATIEPRRAFAVMNGRTRLDDGSRLGLLLAGTAARADDYNGTLGLDWTSQVGPNAAAVQAAVSAHDGRLGWALNSGYSGFAGNFATMGVLRVIDSSFSVEDIGYVPWTGTKLLQVAAGPFLTPSRSEIFQFIAMPSISVSEEPGSTRPCYALGIFCEPRFRSGWHLELDAGAGPRAERVPDSSDAMTDISYLGRTVTVSAEGGQLRYSVAAGVNYNYGYNFNRRFLADNLSNWIFVTYYLAGRVALMFGGTNLWEYDPAHAVASVGTILRPRIDYRINAYVSFNIYDEIVLATPGTRFAETRLPSNRIGCLFSWNIRPKSWLYIAFNDFRVDAGTGLVLADRIGAVKLRYLFYF